MASPLAAPEPVSHLQSGTVLAGRWRTVSLLGTGGFGQVWEAVDERAVYPSFVAIKVETPIVEKSSSLLAREGRILRDLTTCSGVPRFIDSFIDDAINVRGLVMEPVGENFKSLRKRLGPFSSRSTITFAIESLAIISLFHERGYLHRDIKPSNFCIDRAGSHVMLIDFGLAKRFDSSASLVDGNKEVLDGPKQAKTNSFVGTKAYASVAAHAGSPLTFVDDYWSWLFTVIDLTRHQVPWTGMRELENIHSQKKAWQLDGPIDGLPSALMQVRRYLSACQLDGRGPDSNYVRDLLSIELASQEDNDGASWQISGPSAVMKQVVEPFDQGILHVDSHATFIPKPPTGECPVKGRIFRRRLFFNACIQPENANVK